MENLKFASFWKRLGAGVIDTLIFFPLSAIAAWLASDSLSVGMFVNFIVIIVALAYHVLLVKAYGGTLGYLVLKLKVKDSSGSPVGFKGAVLRHSVDFAFALVGAVEGTRVGEADPRRKPNSRYSPGHRGRSVL